MTLFSTIFDEEKSAEILLINIHILCILFRLPEKAIKILHQLHNKCNCNRCTDCMHQRSGHHPGSPGKDAAVDTAAVVHQKKLEGTEKQDAHQVTYIT